MSNQRVWRWAVFGTVGAVLALTVATPIAARAGIKSEWYAGYGQWLGAIGALVAAAVALGIATTDRRLAADLRAAENTERDEDLTREAGLVRVSWEPVTVRVVFSGPITHMGLAITNRRDSPIFDITVTIFEQEGRSAGEIVVNGYCPIPLPESPRPPHRAGVSDLILEPSEGAGLFIDGSSDDDVHAVVEYTDQRGRRWRIDTNGAVTRVIAPPAGA